MKEAGFHRWGREWLDSEGQLHRSDGPAVEVENGRKWWYVHGDVEAREEFGKREAYRPESGRGWEQEGDDEQEG